MPCTPPGVRFLPAPMSHALENDEHFSVPRHFYCRLSLSLVRGCCIRQPEAGAGEVLPGMRGKMLVSCTDDLSTLAVRLMQRRGSARHASMQSLATAPLDKEDQRLTRATPCPLGLTARPVTDLSGVQESTIPWAVTVVWRGTCLRPRARVAVNVSSHPALREGVCADRCGGAANGIPASDLATVSPGSCARASSESSV